MEANPFNVTQEQAREALNKYREHRNSYDARDWEIERIYRAIARGKTIISVQDAIRKAGLDQQGRPNLAIVRADCQAVRADGRGDALIFDNYPDHRWEIRIQWEKFGHGGAWRGQTPRIPPQFRPPARSLKSYHVLFEAEWSNLPPADPFLLRRLAEDAWIVLAAWELTEVELSVMRAARA